MYIYVMCMYIYIYTHLFFGQGRYRCEANRQQDDLEFHVAPGNIRPPFLQSAPAGGEALGRKVGQRTLRPGLAALKAHRFRPRCRGLGAESHKNDRAPSFPSRQRSPVAAIGGNQPAARNCASSAPQDAERAKDDIGQATSCTEAEGPQHQAWPHD